MMSCGNIHNGDGKVTGEKRDELRARALRPLQTNRGEGERMKETIKDWLRLFRAQTAPATVLLLLVPYLAGEGATLVGALIIGIFGLFAHFWSFGQNSLLDTTIIHYKGRPPPDLEDPSKAHHPLVAGRIRLSEAHSVINWGLALLVTVGGIGSLLGANPALSMFSLIIWVIWGWGYNAGLSKVSLLGFLPITICFMGLTGWAWFLTHEAMSVLGWYYFAYVGLTILFQISVEGNLKEMRQAERSNLLIKMGASLRDGRFDPGWALLYGFAVKGASLYILTRMMEPFLSGPAVIWFCFIFVGVGSMTALLCTPRPYDRATELKRMSLLEIISIYAPIPLMVPWDQALTLMATGVAYFYLMNRALWGVSYPKV